MKNKFQTIIGGFAAIAIFALSLPVSASSLPVGVSQFYLAGAGTTATATSIQVTSMLTPDGRPVTMSMFGTVGYAALDPQTNSKIEDISFTGITQNGNGTALLTGVTRGMDFVYPYAATPSLGKTHSGGATLIITNTAGFYYNEFTMNNNNNLFTWPAASSSPASKGYVDFVAFNGAAVLNASETLKGVVQLATQLQAASSTSSGSAGARLVLPASIATSTYNAATAPLRVVVTQNSGKIDNNFIATSTLGLPLSANVQLFTATSGPLTWTKPAGGKVVQITAIGAGAGGNSPNSSGAGGAGGGGGGVVIRTFDASILGSTETITIGIGGAGAPSTGGGAPGSAGGNTSFGNWVLTYGGGGGGGGGGAGMGPGSTVGGSSSVTGGAGGGSTGTAGNTGQAGGSGYGFGAAGGGQGGSGNNVSGGAGGSQLSRTTISGGAAGTGNSNPGGIPSNVTAGEILGGAGGGGGSGAASSGTGGRGGNGGLYGGGGGGGGNPNTTGSGGAGGNGADGVVQVITYF